MSTTTNFSQASFPLSEAGGMTMRPLTLLMVSLGLAALPFVYQMLPNSSSGVDNPAPEVAQALRSGADLTQALGATAAGSGLPMGLAAEEQEVSAYLDQKL